MRKPQANIAPWYSLPDITGTAMMSMPMWHGPARCGRSGFRTSCTIAFSTERLQRAKPSRLERQVWQMGLCGGTILPCR